MSILINMEMPIDAPVIIKICPNGSVSRVHEGVVAKAIPIPPHGRLIDADALRQSMYHKAFETDSPMQKWDSGCWVRYKMFERLEEKAPTIIPAEEGE